MLPSGYWSRCSSSRRSRSVPTTNPLPRTASGRCSCWLTSSPATTTPAGCRWGWHSIPSTPACWPPGWSGREAPATSTRLSACSSGAPSRGGASPSAPCITTPPSTATTLVRPAALLLSAPPGATSRVRASRPQALRPPGCSAATNVVSGWSRRLLTTWPKSIWSC